MTTSRKLEEIVSNLDDMSETIEELKDRAEAEPVAIEKLDKLQSEMTRVTDRIEESLEAGDSPTAPETPIVHDRTSHG